MIAYSPSSIGACERSTFMSWPSIFAASSRSPTKSRPPLYELSQKNVKFECIINNIG